MSQAPPVDVGQIVPKAESGAAFAKLALNQMAGALSGSRILKIASEIKQLQAAGRQICDLTVGDFSPKQFRPPERLVRDISEALRRGETNYPPSVGITELREAVRGLYERELGLKYPIESVVMASGARPPLFATFGLLVQPGDRVIYGLPSWNNNYYCHINGAVPVRVKTHDDTNFLLSAELIEDQLDGATLLCLNSPLNPCGTAYTADQLAGICDVVLAENKRREARAARPLMVLYDQVYWKLAFAGTKHVDPVGLRPEMARFTVFVDAISKWLAATGLRVGWIVVPQPIAGAFGAYIGHMGAWAPRAEQVATAQLLNDGPAIQDFLVSFLPEVEKRLSALHQGFERMRARGLPVRSIAPQGAIYLSARFDVLGRKHQGKTFTDDEVLRFWLLDQAGFATVPFQAFGFLEDTGWMRLSVGAVSMDDIEQGLARIEKALEGVD
jgi:aspartate aminotransferase